MIARVMLRTAMAAVVALLFAVPATAAAPEQPVAKNAQPSSKLPISEGMPQVRLPRPKEVTLENGLRVLVLEAAQQVPTFTARLVLTTGGGLYEPADRRGVASFTADMLREGTVRRSSQDIARQFESFGTALEIDAPLAASAASVTINGLATHFDPVLELLADVIRNPAFRAEEVTQYASRRIADLELQRSRPEFLAQEQLVGALYRGHPASLVAPSNEVLRKITAEDLRQFHRDHYRPDEALLVIVGRVTLDSVLPAVRRTFGDWRGSKVSHATLQSIPNPAARAVRLLDRPGSVQTVLQLGALGISRLDPDYFELLVMNEVFGGRSSSRLYQNLREKHGYTYGAYSGFTATEIPGVWQITTSVRTEVTDGALHELMAEMRRISQQPATEQELASARRALIGRYIFSLEQPSKLLDNIVAQALYRLPAEYWETYPQRVQAVTGNEVMRVAKRVIDMDHLQIAAVGDVSKLREVFAKYGTVQDAAEPVQPAVSSEQAESPSTSGAGGAEFSAGERSQFRSAITRIGDRLLEDAVARADGLTWMTPTEAGPAIESFSFYDGSPGVTYFLLKAYQAVGDEKYLRAAERGLSHLLGQARRDQHGLYLDESSNGVFQGNAGPGYVFLYAHQVTGESQQLDIARQFARRIVQRPDVSDVSNPDIIAGAAGTGLFLLAMHEVTGDPTYEKGARALGDFLVTHAEARGAGATWKLTDSGIEYYFVGFAHGPAGIGYYLDRLYRVTGDARYRTYADRAMSHIESIAIRQRTGGLDNVKWYHEQLQRSQRYPSQWCHGAPGMNPLFLQLYTREADRKFLEWAVANTRYQLEQGVDARKNPSVCHGIAGNAASLYSMYRALGAAEYLAEIRKAVDLLDGALEERLVDGDAVRDDSYMTGLAGVGDFFVLLYSGGALSMFGPLGYANDLRNARAAT
jgi:zinc protease